MSIQKTTKVIKLILEDSFYLILENFIRLKNPTLEWIESLEYELQARNNKMPKEVAELLLFVTNIIQSGKTYSIFNKHFEDNSKIIYNLIYINDKLNIIKLEDNVTIEDKETIKKLVQENLINTNIHIVISSFIDKFQTINDIRNYILNELDITV